MAHSAQDTLRQMFRWGVFFVPAQEFAAMTVTPTGYSTERQHQYVGPDLVRLLAFGAVARGPMVSPV